MHLADRKQCMTQHDEHLPRLTTLHINTRKRQSTMCVAPSWTALATESCTDSSSCTSSPSTQAPTQTEGYRLDRPIRIYHHQTCHLLAGMHMPYSYIKKKNVQCYQTGAWRQEHLKTRLEMFMPEVVTTFTFSSQNIMHVPCMATSPERVE